jgi:hypothetical protein
MVIKKTIITVLKQDIVDEEMERISSDLPLDGPYIPENYREPRAVRVTESEDTLFFHIEYKCYDIDYGETQNLGKEDRACPKCGRRQP